MTSGRLAKNDIELLCRVVEYQVTPVIFEFKCGLQMKIRSRRNYLCRKSIREGNIYEDLSMPS